jgi:hypothetical protein
VLALVRKLNSKPSVSSFYAVKEAWNWNDSFATSTKGDPQNVSSLLFLPSTNKSSTSSGPERVKNALAERMKTGPIVPQTTPSMVAT